MSSRSNRTLSLTRWHYQSQVLVVAFLNNFFFWKEKKALAFNLDRCCHLALCLPLILFHSTRLHYYNSNHHYKIFILHAPTLLTDVNFKTFFIDFWALYCSLWTIIIKNVFVQFTTLLTRLVFMSLLHTTALVWSWQVRLTFLQKNVITLHLV